MKLIQFQVPYLQEGIIVVVVVPKAALVTVTIRHKMFLVPFNFPSRRGEVCFGDCRPR